MVQLVQQLNRLKLKVEQAQEFTPTPGTAATCMYYTGLDPDSGKPVYVARTDRKRSCRNLSCSGICRRAPAGDQVVAGIGT